MHKLDPIERLPDGSLFRLTPGQLRSVRGLTKRCCNFSGGDCLLLDGACPQYTSYYIKVVFIDRSPAECYNKFRMLWIGMYHLPQRRFSGGSNHSFFVEMLIS